MTIAKASSEIVGSNKDNALTLNASYGDLNLDVILIGHFDATGKTQWLSMLFESNLDKSSEAAVKQLLRRQNSALGRRFNPRRDCFCWKSLLVLGAW